MPSTRPTISLNVLCKVWFEDGVWNGVVQDLPVGAFGDTFEHAQANLLKALECHLEAAAEIGSLEQIIIALQEKEHEILSVDEIPPHAALVRLPVVLNGLEVLPVTS